MTIHYAADAATGFVSSTDHAEGLTVSVYRSLEAAEPVWRDLETRAVMTPYQRFDWISAYCRAGFESQEATAIVVMSHAGRPIALIPLGVKRRLGVRQARIIGMPISNCDGLVLDPAHVDKLTPRALRKAFEALGQEGVGVDIVSFHCLVPDWQGIANPLLAFRHAPAPNNFYFSTIEDSAESFIDHALPHKRRANVRRSQRRLIELYGNVSVRMAKTADDIARVHAAFLDQRGKRFRQMGVENIFAQAPFQTLFRTLAIESLGQRVPAFRYHALYAGEDIVATSLGVCTPTHYSQYINSTATTGPASKYSLMGVMLAQLVEQLRAEGITSLDMGLGDFAYKTDWTQAITVHDSVIPVSPQGAIAAPMVVGARQAQRIVKQTPALWTIARTLLALRTRLRGAGSSAQ